uniref:Apoptosis regulator BAX-like n=1 Tax=Paramormyrops kingsleyae TaxID=1676925 RepID=A0A3B3Q8N9_9TELE
MCLKSGFAGSIVEDQLPGEPVNEVLRGLLPEHDVEDEAVNQVAKQVRRIAKDLEKDTLLQQSIDVLRKVCKDSFMKIVEKVIVDGITWEKVIVLLYIAGKFIVKVWYSPNGSLSDILTWTWDFFKRRVLSWIEQQGGWVRDPFLHQGHNLLHPSHVRQHNGTKCINH